MRFVIVTGTGTGVGKTTVTAAFVAAAMGAGRSVSVVKPVQTGTSAAGPSDVATVVALTGCRSVHELVRLEDPLAPDTAARRRGLLIPPMSQLAHDVVTCSEGHDVTFVEGAGGVAVRLDIDGGTVITLGSALRDAGHDVTFVVVTSLALGTLNHTELTVAPLRAQGFEPAGLALGDVPDVLGLAEMCNTTELPRVTGLAVVASLPHGVSHWPAQRFRAHAPSWVYAQPWC